MLKSQKSQKALSGFPDELSKTRLTKVTVRVNALMDEFDIYCEICNKYIILQKS